MVNTVFPGGALLLSVLLLSCAGRGATKEVDNPGITFEVNSNLVYDTKPKLRLRGAGFDLLSSDDLLTLKFEPPLARGDVLAKSSAKTDDTITLELAPGKRWAKNDGDAAPQPLVLKEAFFGDVQLLEDPVTVATLIPTPTVFPSTNIVYLATSPHLKINGTNFNEKSTALYFSPPLQEGADVSIFVKSPTTIWVTLVQKTDGRRWAEEPGPLKLVSIDTGAGPMILRKDLGGVTIAEMQADMKGHGISVETHEEINLYQSTQSLAIAGKGFNPEGTKFRFGNALAEGDDYTVEITASSAVFSLVGGSKWQQNAAALPGPLLLLAADGGNGYVPLGSTMGKSGRRVATVFEDPRLEPSDQEISRTRTHELIIKGTGFTSVFPPLLVFDPHIDREDYVVTVVDRTQIVVSLAGESSGWMPEGSTGPLSVQVVNTGAGMFQFDEPVPVAVVEKDDDPHHSGISILPNYVTQIYQSSSAPLMISGGGFPLDVEPKLTFGFAGPLAESFTCKVVSDGWLELAVVDGHSWATQGGPLMLTKAIFGEHEVTFPSPGLKVATILDDPFVEASQLHVYATHTRHITIQGHGFLSSFDPAFKPQVVLSPTMWGDYTINDGDWTDTAMTISLMPKSTSEEFEIESKWAEVMGEDPSVDIKVVSIDTGAGGVIMPGGGIVVAEVRMDDATFSCEDSCIYANDGQCDEDQNGENDLTWSGYGSNAATSSSQASGSRGYLDYSTTMDATDDLAFTRVPSCPIGTDCTDCGLQMVDEGKCVNSCTFARDGSCDDRRASGVCPDGTDCQDCGPWGQNNFTVEEHWITSQLSIVAYDDDDSSFLAKDPNDPMFNHQMHNGVGRYKRVFVEHKIIRKESESAEGVFMETLWAAIVLVGFSVTGYLTVLAVRCAKGQTVRLPIPTNPDVKREGPR